MLTGLLLLSLLFCVTSGVLNWRWNHSVYWCQRIAPFCCQTHFQRQVSSSLFSPIKENAFSVNSCKSVIIWFSLGFQSKTITKCFDEIFVNIYSTLNRYNSGTQCPNNFPCALLPALPTLFFFFFFFNVQHLKYSLLMVLSALTRWHVFFPYSMKIYFLPRLCCW